MAWRYAALTISVLLIIKMPAYGAQVFIERDCSLGINAASGNTRSFALHADFMIDKNTKQVNQYTFKGYFDQQRSAGEETMFRAGATLRYGYNLSRQAYGFYDLTAEHDRFRGLELRLTPTAGLGWWFSDTQSLSSMAEASFGYDSQNLTSGQTGAAVLELRQFFDSELPGKSRISNDLHVYLDTRGLDNFRVLNTFTWKVPLENHLKFKLTLKDDYSNSPPAGVQNNDIQFVTAIEYAFKDLKGN